MALSKQQKATSQCYQDMKSRCYNVNHRAYKNYGARGIFVCERWKASYQNFLDDMGYKPDGLSLDRINNDLAYSKENCRWATATQQMRNTRRSTKEGVGVHYSKRDDLWIAQITVNHKIKHIGCFKDRDDAIRARKYAEHVYWQAHGIGVKNAD